MNIKHIRMMSFGPSVRLDTLLPKEIKAEWIGKTKQRHVPLDLSATPEEVKKAVQRLNETVRADGFALSECMAPPMLRGCDEPPEHLANAFRAAMN
jgi:hypothetical protein